MRNRLKVELREEMGRGFLFFFWLLENDDEKIVKIRNEETEFAFKKERKE
jgi:hypothetical protein